MFDLAQLSTHRRGFLTRLAGAAGLAAIAPSSLLAESFERGVSPELEAWLNKISGAHRMVFDAPGANGGMPAIWPRIYLNTMSATYGTKGDTAVVILRHEAAPLALGDALWAKYKLGEHIKVMDNGHPATRNTFATITGLPIPGLGVLELLKAGVLFGVCNIALSVLAMSLAGPKGDAEAITKELIAGIYPGIQLVPSGVMAVGRTQEKGCNYCFAG
jgi:intracellular sulfur oxidation DsrE/DsrF family protein